MKKQTAVEWFFDKLKNHEIQAEHFELYKQAKQMEKEQIEDAYDIGFADAWDDARYEDEPTYTGAEQYYNETYGDE